MKQIEITGKTNQKIYLQDNDGDHIESYTKKISSLLESKNIIVLHTSSSSVVIRPSDIFSIEVKNQEVVEDPKLPLEQEIVEEKNEDIPEDTLTDMS
jgi:hypothetical protein